MVTYVSFRITDKKLWKFQKVFIEILLLLFNVANTSKNVLQVSVSFHNIVKKEEGEDKKNGQNSRFSHNFCH